MQEDTRSDTGWQVVAEAEEMATIIDTVLTLDPDRAYTRSELAAESGIPLKTLHLMDDVERAVEIGLLDERDPDGAERSYTVDEESEVFRTARAFGAAVADGRED